MGSPLVAAKPPYLTLTERIIAKIGQHFLCLTAPAMLLGPCYTDNSSSSDRFGLANDACSVDSVQLGFLWIPSNST